MKQILRNYSQLSLLIKMTILIPIMFLMGFAWVIIINRFLSLNRPIPARILIVEGWVPGYIMRTAKEIYERDHYQLIITTGGPLPHSNYYYPRFKTFADLAASYLAEIGIEKDRVIPVPSPQIEHDRTWTSAVLVKTWLNQTNSPETNFNLVSMGPHSRRSWLTYRKVFGANRYVGVISLPLYFGLKPWWRCRGGYYNYAKELVSYVAYRVVH